MSTHNADTPRALLLDDNLMSSVRTKAQLENAGFVVQQRRDLPPQNDANPSLVLINLGSRVLSGVELVKESRARFPAAHVVGFCGHLETEIRRSARVAGVHRIVTNEQAFTDLAGALKMPAPDAE